MEKCRQLNLNCSEVQWLNINEITRFIIFQLYIDSISAWTCILILDIPQIKEPFYCIHRTNLHVGYYGLVIVRPQTFHLSQCNIKYPYWIASIFYMYIDLSERITGKQDAPSHSRHPAPPPPPISKHFNCSHCVPYMKNSWLFFPLLWTCVLYD